MKKLKLITFGVLSVLLVGACNSISDLSTDTRQEITTTSSIIVNQATATTMWMQPDDVIWICSTVGRELLQLPDKNIGLSVQKSDWDGDTWAALITLSDSSLLLNSSKRRCIGFSPDLGHNLKLSFILPKLKESGVTNPVILLRALHIIKAFGPGIQIECDLYARKTTNFEGIEVSECIMNVDHLAKFS